MSILFSGPITTFISLTYSSVDSFNKNKIVYTYDNTKYNLADYEIYYAYHNKVIMISKLEFVPYSNKVKIEWADVFYGDINLLCCTDRLHSIDFIDKYYTGSTVYAYRSFTITNTSFFTKLKNITVISENLTLGFSNVYPIVYNVQYTNGYCSPSIDINLSTTPVNEWQKLTAFIDNVYKGTMSPGGYIAGYNNINTCKLDVLCCGQLEFALSMSGPWNAVLVIPVIPAYGVQTVYARCSKTDNTLFRYLTGVRVFSTEGV